MKNTKHNTSRRNWAKILSWSRLVLIIPISILIVMQQFTAAAVLVLLAAVTDFFDGVVARTTNTQTAYGSSLDGLVDLVFAITTVAWVWIAYPETLVF